MGSRRKPMKKSKRNDTIARRDFLEADLRNHSVMFWRKSNRFTDMISAIAKKQTITDKGIEEHIKRKGQPVVGERATSKSSRILNKDGYAEPCLPGKREPRLIHGVGSPETRRQGNQNGKYRHQRSVENPRPKLPAHQITGLHPSMARSSP